MNIKKTKSYRIAVLGILSAVAITLSFLESLIPTAAFMPPGAKAGFSNIATMFVASSMGFLPAMAVTLIKAAFVLLTRGATAFFMSLSGGILSTAAMFLLFKFTKAGYVEIGIISALTHNSGQLITAAIIVSNMSIIGYIPILLISALVTGAITGTILKAVMPKLNNIKISRIKREENK